MLFTAVVLLITALFFALSKIRSDIVALCSLLSLLLGGVLTVPEALAGFSNPVLIMMLGLFVVGGAIFQTGLAKFLSGKLLRMAGKSETSLFLLVMLSTCLFGSFVSNTGTVALMMPIVAGIALGAGMNAGRLMMPLAFASSMGGMMTLIGTPPNLVISEELVKNGEPPLSFFAFTPVGLVSIVVGIIVLWPLTKWMLGKKGGTVQRRSKSLDDLAKEYQLFDHLFRLRVLEKSALCGRTMAELRLSEKYQIEILEVRRESSRSLFFRSINQQVARADTRLAPKDILYLRCDFAHAQAFAKAEHLEIVDNHTPESGNAPSLKFYDIGIAEIILPHSSELINRTVAQTNLRASYGLNVLGVRRKGEYVLRALKDFVVHEGDVLLVQGSWDNIGRLDEETNRWVVLGRPLKEAAAVTLDYRAPVAALIMVAMVAAMVFGGTTILPVTAVLLAAVLTVLTGCFRNVQAAYQSINWESIVLIGAMLPMSTALQKTGASEWVSTTLVQTLGGQHPIFLLAGVYITSSVLTMFISNTAVAVLMAPIAMQTALTSELSALPFLFAVSVGASMCFASPFSTPPNALVMGAGQYTFMDYIKVGLPLQVIMGVVMILLLPLIFPFAA